MNASLGARQERMERDVLSPMVQIGWPFWLFVAACLAVIGWGVYAWTWQLRQGMIVTGLSNKVSWGFYITNFVFWVGISHAGTFVSAVLRLSDVGWRTPVVRLAEFMTIGALFMGAAMPLVDMGRPDRLMNIVYFGRLGSPILWDILAITSYLVGSMIYLYLPLIPDLAVARDRLRDRVGPVRRWLYRAMALGWHGTPEQWRRLSLGIKIMCILILAVMISVHTVVSWIFAMTWRVGWSSTIFGPYFVVGAIFSGLAAVVTGMAVFRKVYHLEKYITPDHFRWLSNIVIAAGLFYLYFTINEYVSGYYKAGPEERHLMSVLMLHGPWARLFWSYFLGGHLLPVILMSLPWTRNITGITVASVLINIGMWIKRYVIVIPSMAVPQLLDTWGTYKPSWVEIAIVAATFAGFALLVGLLARFFPLIPMWEMREEMEKEPLRKAAAAVGPHQGAVVEEVTGDD